MTASNYTNNIYGTSNKGNNIYIGSTFNNNINKPNRQTSEIKLTDASQQNMETIPIENFITIPAAQETGILKNCYNNNYNNNNYKIQYQKRTNEITQIYNIKDIILSKCPNWNFKSKYYKEYKENLEIYVYKNLEFSKNIGMKSNLENGMEDIMKKNYNCSLCGKKIEVGEFFAIAPIINMKGGKKSCWIFCCGFFMYALCFLPTCCHCCCRWEGAEDYFINCSKNCCGCCNENKHYYFNGSGFTLCQNCILREIQGRPNNF